MSCLNDVATSFVASVIVGKTCTVSMISSTVSFVLHGHNPSLIISAAKLARICNMQHPQ